MSRRRDAIGWSVVGLGGLAAGVGAASTLTASETREIDGQTLALASSALDAVAPFLAAGAVLAALSLAAVAHASVRRGLRDGLGPALGALIAGGSVLAVLAVPRPHAFALSFLPAIASSYRLAWSLVCLPTPIALAAFVTMLSLRRAVPPMLAQLACVAAATTLSVLEANTLAREIDALPGDVVCFATPPITMHPTLTREVPREAITRLGVRVAASRGLLPGGMIAEPRPGGAHDLAELAAGRRGRERMEHTEGWTIDPIVAPEVPGPARARLRGVHGFFTVEADAELHVVRDEPDPRFPLPEGRRLVFEISGPVPRERVEISVSPSELRDGLRTIPIEITETRLPDGVPRHRTEHLVPTEGRYAWDHEPDFLAPAGEEPMRARSGLFGDCLLGPHGPAVCKMENAIGRRDVAIATVLTFGLALPLLASREPSRLLVRLVEVDGAPVAATSPVDVLTP